MSTERTVSFPLTNITNMVVWEGLACGQAGKSFKLNDYNDNIVTATGDFNSETVTLQGSNDEEGLVSDNWFTLVDLQGNDITFSAAGMTSIHDAPEHLRPSFSGASGGDVDIRLKTRKVT